MNESQVQTQAAPQAGQAPVAEDEYQAQADRIARLWPRVTGSWDGLSSAAGTLPHTG